MSYDAREASRDNGAPFFLYEFIRGTGPSALVNRFTSLAEDVDALGSTFSSSSISHGRVTTGGGVKRDALEIEFPMSDAFAQSLLGFSTPQRTFVTVWRAHYGETETRVLYKGTVEVAKPSPPRITVECTSLYSLLRNPGLTARITRSCRHALYGGGCGLALSSFQVDVVLASVSGPVLTFIQPDADTETPQIDPSIPEGDLVGGLVEWNGLRGFITAHAGEEIRIRTEIDGLSDAFAAAQAANPVAVVTVKVAPGCDRSRARCHARFGNSINHGGFPYMPSKNPFGGSSII